MANQDADVVINVSANAAQARDELRFAGETVQQLGQQVDRTGAQSEAFVAEIAALRSELDRLGAQQAAVDQIGKLRDRLQQTEADLRQAADNQRALTDQVQASLGPSRAQQAELEKAGTALQRLEIAVEKARTRQRDLTGQVVAAEQPTAALTARHEAATQRLSGLERALEAARDRVRAATAAVTEGAGPTEKLASAHEQATEALERLQAQAEFERQALQQLEGDLGASGLAATELAGAQAELAQRTAAASANARTLAERVQAATPAIQTAEQAFAALGITSTAALQKAAAEARTAFAVLQRSGTASATDLDRAFEAVAAAELKVAAAAGETQVAVAAAGLRQQAATQGQIDALAKLEASYRDTADAATRAARSAEQAFSTLGVTSSAKLEAAAEQARLAFAVLQRSGVATALDLDRAFEAVAAAELRVAAASGETAVQVTAAGLRNRATTLGQVEALQRLEAEYARAGAVSAASSAAANEQGQQAISTLQRVQSLALGLAGITAGVAFVKQLTDIADEAKNVEARLKLATGSSEEFARAQADVARIAQETRVAYAATAETYGKLNLAVKSLGGNADDTATVLAAINQAVTLSGVSAEQSSAGLIQFAQGLQSGRLQGDELRSVLENLPALASALAQGLGVTTGELRKLGEQGALTPEQILGALEKAAPQIAAKFAQIPETVGGALTNLKSQLVVAIGSLDSATGSSAALARGIEELSALIRDFGANESLRNAFAGIGSTLSALVSGTRASYELLASILSGIQLAFLTTASGIVTALSKITFGDVSASFAQAAAELDQSAAAAADRVGTHMLGLADSVVDAKDSAVDGFTKIGSAALDVATGVETAAGKVAAANAQAGASFTKTKDAGLEVSAALLGTLSPAVAEVVKQYSSAAAAGGSAAKSATGFADEAKRLGLSTIDAVKGLSALDAAGKITAANFDEQLSKVLKEVADQDLPRLTRALTEEYQTAVARAADNTSQLRVALDTLREQTLARLGIDAKEALSGIAKEIDSAALALRSLAGNATTSAAEIQLAFDASLAKVRTRQDAQLIATAISEIRVAGFDAEGALRQLQTRLQGLAAESPGLQRVEAALQRLGVTSQQSLDAAAAAAKADFEQIAASGTQTTGVLAAAFAKLAEAQIAAAATQGESALRTAELQLLSLARTEAQRDAVEQLTARYAAQSGILLQIAADARTADAAQAAATARQLDGQGQIIGGLERIAELQRRNAEAQAASERGAVFAIANLVGLAEDYYKKISDGALEEFQRIVRGASIYGDSVLNFFSNVARGQAQLDRQIAEQRVGAERLLESLGSVYGATANNLDLAQQAARSFRLLDQQTLSQLNSAITRVKSNLDGLRDSARSAVSTLQDELDQLEGNQQAIEQRRDATKRAELQAQLDEARRAGDRQSVADLERALALLDQITRVREQQRQEEERQRQQQQQEAAANAAGTRPATQPAAPAPAPAPASVTTPAASAAQAAVQAQIRYVRFVFEDGTPVDVLEPSADPFEAMLEKLARARRTSN